MTADTSESGRFLQLHRGTQEIGPILVQRQQHRIKGPVKVVARIYRLYCSGSRRSVLAMARTDHYLQTDESHF